MPSSLKIRRFWVGRGGGEGGEEKRKAITGDSEGRETFLLSLFPPPSSKISFPLVATECPILRLEFPPEIFLPPPPCAPDIPLTLPLLTPVTLVRRSPALASARFFPPLRCFVSAPAN